MPALQFSAVPTCGMPPAIDASVHQYAAHWDKLHEKSGGAACKPHEWHTIWKSIADIVRPYLHAAACMHNGSAVADIGCGSSTMGLDVLRSGLGFSQLLLIDAAMSVLEAQRATGPAETKQATAAADASSPLATAHVKHQHADNGTQHYHQAGAQQQPSVVHSIELLASDCRQLPLKDGCVQAIIDKGTLDALWSDNDKLAMLRECARILDPCAGVMLSISFSSPARLQLLSQHCPALKLQFRVHVVGPGDPARGHEVRFLTVLAYDFGQVTYQPDDLTDRILRRIQRNGSLLDDDGDDADDHLDSLDESGVRLGRASAKHLPMPDLFSDD